MLNFVYASIQMQKQVYRSVKENMEGDADYAEVSSNKM